MRKFTLILLCVLLICTFCSNVFGQQRDPKKVIEGATSLSLRGSFGFSGASARFGIPSFSSAPSTSLNNGMFYYNSTSHTVWNYLNSAWEAVMTGTYPISLANGGTGAALGNGSAGNFLRSDGAGATAWSTATLPATLAANLILYGSSANVIGGLATANNGALVTNGSGVPSISSTLPSAVQGNITSLGTMAGNIAMGGNKVTGLGTPTASGDAVTKVYTDDIVSNIKWRQEVACATTGNIALTGEQTIDGELTSTSRVLVKDQSTGSQNGVYVSDASTWSRAADQDAGGEILSSVMRVLAGSVNGTKSFINTNVSAITVGVTAITYGIFDGGLYSASTGIVFTGGAISTNANQSHVTTLGSVGSGTWGSGAVISTPTMTLGSDADYDIYYRASNVLARLAPNTVASNKFLRMIGTGAAGQAPSWEALVAGDIPDISATYQPLDADLTTLAGPTTWRMFYSDGSSVITELALGANGTFLESNGASAAPAYRALTVADLTALTASRAVQTGAGGALEVATTTSTELGYVNGVTSGIQTQIDAKDDIDWNEGLTVDGTYEGKTVTITVGESVVFGKVLVKKSDGEYYLTDADAVTTMPGHLMALATATDGNTCLCLVTGYVCETDWNWTVGDGRANTLYCDDGTAGNMVQHASAPSDVGDQVGIVGRVITADCIHFKPTYELTEVGS